MESLDELLQDELKDIYDAEKQLTKALPKMAKKATNEDLKQAFEEHLQQTEQHIERLDQVFEQLDLPARVKKCEGLRGLIQEPRYAPDAAGEDLHRLVGGNTLRPAPRGAQVMSEIVGAFFDGQRLEIQPHRNTLIERRQCRLAKYGQKMRLANEDDLHRLAVRRFEIAEEPQFFQEFRR